VVNLQAQPSEYAQTIVPRSVAIVGAGPAGLMAAEVLSAQGHRVTVFDRMQSVGRKFLMAGRGGLNLTHSEPLEEFLTRYAKNAGDTGNSHVLDAWSRDIQRIERARFSKELQGVAAVARMAGAIE
jgi:NADPH-dependent 2,4-dienoyl-CoA reductase/sulfur reductase-like enzyme